MMKANGIIIIGISVAMVITGCGNNTKEFILDGYKSCDEYFDDGFKKYTDYCKYYYDKSFDVTFSENSYYTVVSKDYVKVIKQYFNNFQSEFMSEPDNMILISSCITEGDYYYRKEEGGGYDVGLYDLESHTLYYIHDN